MIETTKDIECLGGPNDGKVFPVGPEQGEHCCMAAISNDGQHHWYVVVPHNGKDTFMHAGTDPRNIVELLRPHNPAMAEALAAQMEEADDEGFEEEDGDFSYGS